MSDIRLLFTADLHIGRSLHGVSLLADQRFCLQGIIDQLRLQRVQLLVIGGDLFDRAVPSAEAVALADWFFQECVSGLGTQVVVIAGNHDSPERLDFAAGLLARQGLHIVGAFPGRPEALKIDCLGQAAELWALPYAEPATIHQCLDRLDWPAGPSADPGNHQLAWERLTAWMASRPAPAQPVCRILAAHLFVTGGTESESERPLCIGGSQAVSPATFAAFDLVLLGHLHRGQECAPGVHYAGSPLAYSASEAGQAKSTLLVTIKTARPAKKPLPQADPGRDLFGDLPQGASAARTIQPRVERLPLVPRRSLRRINGLLDTLMAGGSDDYVFIALDDPLPVPDAYGRLKTRYPWLLAVERTATAANAGAAQDGGELRRQAVEAGDLEVIRVFIREMTGQEPPPDWMDWINQTLEAQRQSLRDGAEP